MLVCWSFSRCGFFIQSSQISDSVFSVGSIQMQAFVKIQFVPASFPRSLGLFSLCSMQSYIRSSFPPFWKESISCSCSLGAQWPASIALERADASDSPHIWVDHQPEPGTALNLFLSAIGQKRQVLVWSRKGPKMGPFPFFCIFQFGFNMTLVNCLQVIFCRALFAIRSWQIILSKLFVVIYSWCFVLRW